MRSNIQNTIIKRLFVISLMLPLALATFMTPQLAHAVTDSTSNVPMCKTKPNTFSWNKQQVFQKGEFCLYSDATNTKLEFTQNGEFVWQMQNGKVLMSSYTWGQGQTLQMNTDGNIIVKNASGKTLWGVYQDHGWITGGDPLPAQCHYYVSLGHDGSILQVNGGFGCTQSGAGGNWYEYNRK